MESQIWHLSAGSVALLEEGSGKYQRQRFYLGESYPQDLALMPDNSVLPSMFLVPFNLLELRGSKFE